MPSDARRVIVPMVALALLAATYMLIRSNLAFTHVALVEYPIALALVAFLAWRALRRPRPRAHAYAPAPALRRHEQIVRTLPDPESAALGNALAAWVATGERPEAAADAIARAHAPDAARRDLERARLLPLLQQADSRRSRARLLRTFAPGDPE